jgi:hypothetical protein
MYINNQSIESGTIVLGRGHVGAIDLPWGRHELMFNPSTTPMNILLNTEGKIIFDGTDNPLGVCTELKIPMDDSRFYYLNIAVYAIGAGDTVSRVVHYSGYEGG